MAPPVKSPFWLDNNTLVGIDNKTMPFAEAELRSLQRDGATILVPKSVEIEFLHGAGFKLEDMLRRTALLKQLPVEIDTLATQIPLQQLRAWRDEAVRHGLSIPDADIIAQVRAGAAVRGVRNPVFLTRDVKALAAMRRRGALALEFKAQFRVPVPEPPVPKVIPKPPVSAIKGGLQAVRSGFAQGFKAAFSAENLASMIPEVILMIADRVAVKEAIKAIEVKFLKEGFSKGVAAGVMGWTDAEVEGELRNRVTPFRVKGLDDPAGFLTLSYMLQLAQAYEDYGVNVGFVYASSKSLEWKNGMRGKGFPALVDYEYHWPEDPRVLFEYNFIDKLAWVLHRTTDAIVEPAIRTN